MEFNESTHKSVVIISGDLPLGLAMNALSVIGVSLGKTIDELVGPDVFSSDGVCFPGVIRIPLPVLKAGQTALDAMHVELQGDKAFELFPFSCLAQSCKTYDEYEQKLSSESSGLLKLSGLGIVGPKKEINKFTGSLPLYR
ncbi:MAG: DUF2000 domain-containing protein [Pseudomonadota bacterium]